MQDDDRRPRVASGRGRRVRVAAAAAIALLAATTAGCGSDADTSAQTTATMTTARPQADAPLKANGIQSRSPAEIMEETRQAALDATAVHVRSHLDGSVLDVEFVRGEGARGSFIVSSAALMFRVIGDDLFINGDESLARVLGFDEAAAATAADRWLRMPLRDAHARFRRLAEMEAFLDGLFTIGDGTLTKGRLLAENGIEAVPVAYDDGKHQATVRVAVVGRPFPLRVDAPGRTGDLTILDRWNEPIELTPPAPAVDAPSAGDAA